MQPAAPIAIVIAPLQRARQFLQHLYRRIVEDDCLRSAAALTYLTLFALVPMMTVAYAVLSAVPTFDAAGDQIEQFIFSHFVPGTAHDIRGYLQRFSQQARHLTGIGVAFLLLTAYGMLADIERTLNAIWRAPPRRGGVLGLLRHWAILSLGPLCIALALAISTYLLSLRVLEEPIAVPLVQNALLRLTPWLLTSAAFTLIYVAVPNTYVRVRDALVGGIVAGLCFELAKWLLTLGLTRGYETVYGAFATLPLFLFWIYLSWIILLLGAELAFAVANYGEHRTQAQPDLLLALTLLDRLGQQQRRGEAITQRQLIREPWLPPARWATLRETLARTGWIRLATGDVVELNRDLGKCTLWQLIDALGLAPPVAKPDTAPAWLTRYCELTGRWRAQDASLLETPLAALFASSTPDSASAPPARA
jgi:membrane protein